MIHLALHWVIILIFLWFVLLLLFDFFLSLDHCDLI
jgi:hypothetical protein